MTNLHEVVGIFRDRSQAEFAVAAAVVGEAVGAAADTSVGVEAPLDGDTGVAQPAATTATATARTSTLDERRD